MTRTGVGKLSNFFWGVVDFISSVLYHSSVGCSGQVKKIYDNVSVYDSVLKKIDTHKYAHSNSKSISRCSSGYHGSAAWVCLQQAVPPCEWSCLCRSWIMKLENYYLQGLPSISSVSIYTIIIVLDKLRFVNKIQVDETKTYPLIHQEFLALPCQKTNKYPPTKKNNLNQNTATTLPETNSSPLKIGHVSHKETSSYSNHPFSSANWLLVSGRVTCGIRSRADKSHPIVPSYPSVPAGKPTWKSWRSQWPPTPTRFTWWMETTDSRILRWKISTKKTADTAGFVGGFWWVFFGVETPVLS